MSVCDIEIDALTGGPANLAQYKGTAVLIVNIASQCGLTCPVRLDLAAVSSELHAILHRSA
ncbi:hypothetical protein [Streptomyces chrestomyceticus]|uniref:hypothetical protein n=1 Tax=Streptomyces chrestomyceticus TaxID=68185 RepID=UPI0037B11869